VFCLNSILFLSPVSPALNSSLEKNSDSQFGKRIPTKEYGPNSSLAGKEFAIGKRMRENKLMLTLTQRSLGAIPVSERRAAEMLKKVVVIAATLLAVSAGADVPLEGSG
jgi:hypothetical protein